MLNGSAAFAAYRRTRVDILLATATLLTIGTSESSINTGLLDQVG
jgi:hypothetical protein